MPAAATQKRRRKVNKTFTKEVLRPGVYWPRDESGKPYRLEVTDKEIKKWHDDTKRALANGNQIPMPYVHTPEAVPFLSGQPRPGAYDNGGHLKDVRIRDDGTLEAVVEAATVKDANRLGTSARNVSFWAKPWTDGKGNSYTDAWRHLAIVNHPIHVDQKNFEPYEVPSEGIALSLMMAADTTPDVTGAEKPPPKNRLESVLKRLEEFGLALPDDTDEMTFLSNLDAALTAVISFKETQQGEMQQLEQPPQGSKTQQPQPLAMSAEIAFALETVRETPNNPATGKPWTPDELSRMFKKAEAAKPTLEFSAEQKAQLAAVQKQAKLPLVHRIGELVRKKVVSPRDAQDNLLPLVNGVELKFSAEGDVVADTPIHVILSQLEKLAPGATLHGRTDLEDSVQIGEHKFSLEDGLKVHDPPRGFTEETDDEVTDERKAVAERMAEYAAG